MTGGRNKKEQIMKNPKFEKGFTLIELLVAMSLFVVFIAIASGGFIRALRTQRAIVALMAVNDNTSLVLEQMSREMRTGYGFCTNDKIINKPGNNPYFPDCSRLNNNELAFIDINNQVILYRLNNNGIERAILSSPGQPNYVKITGENVNVRSFKIGLMGNEPGDEKFPRITISVKVSPESNEKYLENFYSNAQSTVSSRSLDT
jgi:prepilin-type N-terminal cleavage/methylation domain-containing protein